jgi:hypothetical protein
MCTTREEKSHAQDDGFPPQEDTSKTASGARRATAGEKGSKADTKECEEERYFGLTATRY